MSARSSVSNWWKRIRVAVLLLPALPFPTIAAPQPPNILFILVDDLGAKDLSNEGSTYYETPHIDSIANGGMKFTRGYAACQVCSPSRATILTGRFPTRHKITTYIGDRAGNAWKRNTSHLPPDYARNLSASEVTLAEVLQTAGYQTFFAGKWHLGGPGSWPLDHGFDFNAGGWDAGSPAGGYFAPFKNPNLKDGPPGESLPLRLADETVRFLESRDPEKPFLAYLSFYSVHGPIQTTQGLWGKYREKAVAAGLAEERFLLDRRMNVRQVQDCPIYAGMMETMDTAIGKVLTKLTELGLTQETIICFTSDNGGVSSGDAFSTSILPLRGGKGRQWEGGIRVPFYVVAPGTTQPGTFSNTNVHGSDWYPTLLELANVEVPNAPQIDGTSLLPVLNGSSIPERDLFWHYPHYGNQGGDPSSIVMRGDWKLIYYHETKTYELYNIAADIAEQQDVAHQHAEVVQAMQARLTKWLDSTAATYPSENVNFDADKFARQLEHRRTGGKRALERRHARFLDADFQPNADWWGSVPRD